MVDSKENYKFDLGVKELSTCGGQSNIQLSIKRDCIGFCDWFRKLVALLTNQIQN